MSGRKARRIGISSKRTVAIAAAVLASGLVAGCGKPGEPTASEPPPLSYADSLVLVVSGGQMACPGFMPEPKPEPAYAAGFIAALASTGSTAAAAINRSGAVVFEIDPRARTLRLKELSSPEFLGRTVDSLLADGDDSFIVSLYRHPDEQSPAPGGSLLRLDAATSAWKPESLPSPIDSSSVYSMNRLDDGGFLLTTRRLDGDRVETARWLVGPGGAAKRVSLADFERMLSPRSIRSAPPALAAALEALASRTGARRILAFARNPQGDGAWYVHGDGPPELAVEAIAALDESGAVAFTAFPEGPALVARDRGDSIELVVAPAVLPRTGATWNGALIHGDSADSLVLLLSWWVERFPDTAGAGMLVVPLAGPGRAAAL
jgi:hypothetical protein